LCTTQGPPDAAEIKERIRERGLALGFDKVGFAPTRLPQEESRLAGWLAQDHHGEMSWLAMNPERRTDVRRSLPEAQTVICCALNYYRPPAPRGPLQGVISIYACGEDYHRVLGEKLAALNDAVEQLTGVGGGKIYVDTGPVLEKAYAVAAGLGWLGKHSNLLSREGSSWFFLGEILTPLRLPPDTPEREHCGTCVRCIEACPTRAIVSPGVVDSRLCISYLTIELRGAIPRELRPAVGQRIYGCDDCQDVCPWNRFARKSTEARFLPKEPLATMDLIDLLRLSAQEFLLATRGSAIRRARYAGFLRNVAVALGNSGDRRAVGPLIEALDHDQPLVRAHVAWALSRFRMSVSADALRRRRYREDDPMVREEIEWALAELS
jgi:epoxyqueuosine reductase